MNISALNTLHDMGDSPKSLVEGNLSISFNIDHKPIDKEDAVNIPPDLEDYIGHLPLDEGKFTVMLNDVFINNEKDIDNLVKFLLELKKEIR
jgi:hypothetical protein